MKNRVNNSTQYTKILNNCNPENREMQAARVQPWQDPGGTLGMHGIGERRHERPALIGPSLRGREREREKERERDQMWGAAESGNALFFTVAFIP